MGGHQIKNRIVLAPMSVSYGSPEGHVTPRVIEHYSRRAAGGAAIVITENIAIDVPGRQLPRQLLASDERFLPGLTELAAGIKENGAVAIAQIVHSGRYAGPWQEYEARRRLAPSAIDFELLPDRQVCPAEISLAEIAATIEGFAGATSLIRRAGFDGVEIHGGSGFLVGAFQSARTNQRTDAYGRDRDLFPMQVLDAVVDAAGDDLLVGYHLLSDEMMPGGWTPADACEFLERIDQSRLDFLIPVPTTFESLRSKFAAGAMDAADYNPDVTALLARVTSIPMFANGGIRRPAEAEAVLERDQVEAIAMGRALLSDPDLPQKVFTGRPDEIVTCPCSPPMCLRTQMSGTICESWPPAVKERGFWGMDEAVAT
jgi:2,4-dienoyl-CoA reductase (NADPH2)